MLPQRLRYGLISGSALFVLAFPLFSQVRLVETRLFPLAGSPAAPLAEGGGDLFLVEGYDAQGRLVRIGRAPDTAKKQGEAPQAGGAARGSGASATGSGGAADQAKRGAVPSPDKAGPVKAAEPAVELDFLDLRYDAAGRIVELAEAKGSTPTELRTRRGYDGEGRLVRVERWEKDSLALSLEIWYTGSGLEARVLLRDASGSLTGSAELAFGTGGALGRAMKIAFADSAGEPAGGLALAWDAAGRLVTWEVLEDPPKGPAVKKADTADASASKDMTAGKGAAAAGAESAIAAEPGIAELLLPIWPSDGPGFELFARLSATLQAGLPPDAVAAARAFRDSGLGVLPFGRPSAGRAEFDWDGAGRLIAARHLDATGRVDAELGCEYDAAGLLVEEGRREAAPVKKAEAGASDAKAAKTEAEKVITILHVYKFGSGSYWVARSSFVRNDSTAGSSLSPLEYRERRVTSLPR